MKTRCAISSFKIISVHALRDVHGSLLAFRFGVGVVVVASTLASYCSGHSRYCSDISSFKLTKNTLPFPERRTAHGVENLDATELAPEESDKETVFEPFNLEQERQEGYFDDDGTYQYVKNDESDEEKDAWLENVDVDQTFSTAVDQSAGVHKHKAVDESHDQAEMTDTEVAAMKKELCQYLQSGETVLSALKRLGRGGKARAGETFAKSGKKKTPEPSMMTADDKILFGKLTELSSALMSAGVYDVYNVRREEIERAAEVSGSKAGGGDESERRSSNDEATVPDGYVLDPQTGLFKNHESGLMYSPENGAFTDGEGKWWWYDEITNCFVEWT